MIYHANTSQKTSRVAILISKYISEWRILLGIKEGHFIMIKGSLYQKDIILNIYASNYGNSKTWNKSNGIERRNRQVNNYN